MTQSNPMTDAFETWSKSFTQFTGAAIPGFSVDSMMKTGQANIAALTEANRIAIEGLQAVAKRQQEMAAAAISDFQETAKTIGAGKGTEMFSKPVEMAREAFEKSVANMKELAELAGKSQTEAWGVIGRRFQDSLSEVQATAKPAAKK
ncbi:MAG: phasin family protein [Alphaproteobacteria bacterium]|nr:phasin family protein [Alphaproteobacteria bacterium]